MNRVILLSLASVLAMGQIAHATELNIQAETRAKLAKEKAKQNALRGAQDEPELDKRDDQQACGAVDIGNVFTGGKNGRAGPREVNVLVTGDIINVVDSNCK